MTAQQPVLFEEHQRFRQPWIWILVLGVGTVPLLILMRVLTRGPHAPGEVATWLGSCAVVALVAALLYVMELTVRVTPAVLEIRYFPFVRRRIPLDEIALCEPVTFNPVLDAGGWGIHYSLTGYGWAFNVS